MKLEKKDKSLLFSSTEIPDVFFTEYLPLANGDYVKVYIYLLFLSNYDKEANINELSKILGLPFNTVQDAFKFWEEQGVIIKKSNGYSLANIQEIELSKLYNPKVTSSPEKIMLTEQSKYRANAIESINNQFFQGLMSPAWYTDIDLWFNKYGFDEQVMIALFNYCADNRALHRNYIQTVADAWFKNNIKTFNDLDDYFAKSEKLNILKKEISKKLKLQRSLNTFEEEYISKWNNAYGYNMDIIELALKKSTSKVNAGFDYYDKLLTDWHSKGLTSVYDINAHMASVYDKKSREKQIEKIAANQYEYTQSTFDSLSSLYDN